MAKPGKMKKRPPHDHEEFPVLFEDGHLRVFRNKRMDVIVENVNSGVKLCFLSGDHDDLGLKFLTGATLIPVRIEGKAGWRATR